jgi:hypothetical protein
MAKAGGARFRGGHARQLLGGAGRKDRRAAGKPEWHKNPFRGDTSRANLLVGGEGKSGWWVWPTGADAEIRTDIQQINRAIFSRFSHKLLSYWGE